MRSTLLAAIAALVVTTPVFGQTVYDTHAELIGPSGRMPIKIFRPLAAEPCKFGHHGHAAGGRLPIVPPPTTDKRGCVVQSADRLDATRTAAR